MSRWFSRRRRTVVRIAAGSVLRTDADNTTGVATSFAFALDAPAATLDGLEPTLHDVLAPVAAARTRIVFELATELCRFQVVPWVHGLHSRDDRTILARSRFEAAFGAASRDWSVELCEGGFGRGGLAVGVPAMLPAAIARACLETRATAAEIRPACAPGIDQLLREAGAKPAWLVVPDGEHTFVGSVHRGSWTGVSMLYENGNGFFRALGDLLARETMLAGGATAGAPVFIYVPPRRRATDTLTEKAAPRPPLETLEAAGHRWALRWVGL